MSLNYRIFFFLALLFSFIILMMGGCFNEGQPISDLNYMHETITNSDGTKTNIHRVEFSLKDLNLGIATSGLLPKKGEVLQQIAQSNLALAAINANGFSFPSDYALMKGNSRVGSLWYTSSLKDTATVGWDSSGQVKFGIMNMMWEIIIDGKVYSISYLNSNRLPKTSILYTSLYRERIKPDSEGIDIIVHNGVVAEIRKEANVPVPRYGYIYSVANDSGIDISKIKVGQQVEVMYGFRNRLETLPELSWNKCLNIVGVGPMLVWDGKPALDLKLLPLRPLQKEPEELFNHEYSRFSNQPPTFRTVKNKVSISKKSPQATDSVSERNPRTAICQKKDETIVLMTVEGRLKSSVGFSLFELQNYLINSIECQYAVNLDGGGSSSLYFNGQMKGSPAGYIRSKRQLPRTWREIPNAIIVTPK
jgi:exopolysaccharide biosynthesis protein